MIVIFIVPSMAIMGALGSLLGFLAGHALILCSRRVLAWGKSLSVGGRSWMLLVFGMIVFVGSLSSDQAGALDETASYQWSFGAGLIFTAVALVAASQKPTSADHTSVSGDS